MEVPEVVFSKQGVEILDRKNGEFSMFHEGRLVRPDFRSLEAAWGYFVEEFELWN